MGEKRPLEDGSSAAPNKKRKDAADVEPKGELKDGTQLQRYVQILGTDSADCCPSVLVVTESCRIIFNAGDGLQRLCSQYQVRLNKLEHLFLTQLHADTLGGLLGMYLTLSDSGVKKLSVHGPRGIKHFLRSGKGFCENRPESDLVPVEIGPDDVQAVVLDHVSILPLPTGEDAKSGMEGAAEVEDGEKTSEDKKHAVAAPSSALAASYLLRFADEAGRMDLDKALALGVPKGPLLGKLKAGHSVTLSDGKIVEPQDCVEDGTEGPLVGIWICPELGSIKKLEDSMTSAEAPPPLKNPQNSKPKTKKLSLVIHMSPNHILLDETYKKLVEDFCEKDAKHIILNSCVGEVNPVFPSHSQIISQLNKLSPVFFPLPKECEKKTQKRQHLMEEIRRCNWQASDVHKDILPASIMLKFGIKPAKYSGLYHFDQTVLLKQVLSDDSEDISSNLIAEAETVPPSLQGISRESAEVLILGTAASVPGKYRNVSAIFVNLFERGGVLLDCGEGTLGQLARFYGDDKLEEIIAKMTCVWISHMHADHHLGLLRILSYHRRRSSEGSRPITIIGPPALRKWLRSYQRIEEIEFEFIFNADIRHSLIWSENHLLAPLASTLGLRISSVQVKHSCRDACGVVLESTTSPSWKIVYSGDTRPCKELVSAGSDAALLIHEATHENKLLDDARFKKHSTTQEALNIAKDMNAFRTVLTHFSQRYPKVPLLTEIPASSNAVAAFDLMCINLADLPRLPSILDPVYRLSLREGWNEELEE